MADKWKLKGYNHSHEEEKEVWDSLPVREWQEPYKFHQTFLETLGSCCHELNYAMDFAITKGKKDISNFKFHQQWMVFPNMP